MIHKNNMIIFPSVTDRLDHIANIRLSCQYVLEYCSNIPTSGLLIQVAKSHGVLLVYSLDD